MLFRSVLNLEEEQLNKEEEEENKNKFDPIKFLVNRLREKNLNIKGKDEFDESLDKIENTENNMNNEVNNVPEEKSHEADDN